MTAAHAASAIVDDVATFEICVDDQVIEVPWGRRDAIGTAAFWIGQTLAAPPAVPRVETVGSLRSRVEEELVFCLLGGFGVSAEAARVAHDAVRPEVASTAPVDAGKLREVLSVPLADGRRYRFPNQRSERIADALNELRCSDLPDEAADLRELLERLPGVGPKTSAWIVRNTTSCDEVAIIDIWLIRALRRCGVFRLGWTPERDYALMEMAFLQYAAAGGVPASSLDLVIWEQARVLFPALKRIEEGNSWVAPEAMHT